MKLTYETSSHDERNRMFVQATNKGIGTAKCFAVFATNDFAKALRNGDWQGVEAWMARQFPEIPVLLIFTGFTTHANKDYFRRLFGGRLDVMEITVFARMSAVEKKQLITNAVLELSGYGPSKCWAFSIEDHSSALPSFGSR